MPQVVAAAGRVARRRRRRREVGRLASVSVQPSSPRECGGRVVERGRGAAALVVGGACRTRQVGDRGDRGAAAGGGAAGERRRVADDRDLAARDGEVRRPGRVGSRQRRADGGGRRELHEVVPARRDRPGQRRSPASVVPDADAYWIVQPLTSTVVDAAVEELDEVVREGRARVAATRVDLADDDVRGGAVARPARRARRRRRARTKRTRAATRGM